MAVLKAKGGQTQYTVSVVFLIILLIIPIIMITCFKHHTCRYPVSQPLRKWKKKYPLQV